MSGEEKKEGGEGGVRNTLVTSIAANIFDTLKSNDDIAAILNGVLDPARTDKVKLLISHHSLTSVREHFVQEVLMKNLMSTINTSLQDSLLRNSRAGSLQSDALTPETSDSMRSASDTLDFQ